MKKTPLVNACRAAATVCASALVMFFGFRPANAGILGSAHDFGAKPIASEGSCSPCHRPHTSVESVLRWSRPLSQERTYLTQNSAPNYLPDTTLLCYDCHDDSGTSALPSIDADPPRVTWTSGHEPQDVVFTDGPPAAGGVKVGFYELIDGEVPGGSHVAPTDGSPTGGHYWQSEPSGTPDYARGDKIACSLCHDPHKARTGSNEVFFLTQTGNGGIGTVTLGDGLSASDKNDTSNPNRSRNGTGTGREMCAACHSYSNQGTPVTLWSVALPKPPANISQHRAADTTACTACHAHNKVNASCEECHGFPPLVETPFNRVTNKSGQSYTNGAGAHQRHKDALGDAIFDCTICHGPNPGTAVWHNFGAGTVVQTNVDIMGETAYWGAGSSYNGTTSGGTATHAFAAKGGNDGTAGGRCGNLLCHGNPPATVGTVFLNWTDNMVDGDGWSPVTGVAEGGSGDVVGDGASICFWCHDSTPARIGATGVLAPNVGGNETTWGANVNGHGLAAASKYDRDQLSDALGRNGAGKHCIVCHDARYKVNVAPPPNNVPRRTHFDALNDTADKRLKGTEGTVVNSLAAANADALCTNCHQNAGADAGTQVSTHGNDFAGNSEGARASMSRACRQCHDVHGANWNNVTAPPRNLFMVGRWVDANNNGIADDAANEAARVDSNATDATTNVTSADLPVVLARRGTPTTASMDDSFDDGFNDGLHESVCVVCHVSLQNLHNQVGDNTLQGAGHNPVGTDCTACHDHDYDNAVATADAFAPSGCYACHGTDDTEPLLNDPNAGVQALRRQFWPDGDSPFAAYDYADNQTGAHRKHVESMARQLYGEAAAQVVLDYSAANPTLTSADKQKTICAFCHPDPGGGGHSTDDAAAPSGAGRANVYGGTAAGNWLRKYVPNAGSRAAFADDTTATPPNGYNFATQSCSGGAGAGQNLACHNQAATPAAPTGWNAPPAWTASVDPNRTCWNIACHATATYTIAHGTHVGGSPKSYACTECHADNYTVSPTNPIPLAHGNGEVDMKFDNAGSLEVSHGGDGFYDKDSSAGTAPSAGDTAFAYKSGGALATDPAYARSCYRVYCHGGDNDNNLPTSLPDWGGTTTSPSPVWNSIAVPLACTTCHGAAPTTARHIAHDNNNAWVPNECGSCHVANNDKTTSMGAFATHGNGSADMAAAVPYIAPNCTNACHLVGVAVPPVSSNPGDWLDANPLACTDCHSATYIGTAPSSGLHAATTAMAHDAQFMATAGESPETATCTHCHLASGPSSLHLMGSAGAVPPTQNSTETTYSFNTAYIPDAPPGSGYVNTGYPAATSCQATCHSDYKLADTGGLWRRQWVGVADLKPLATDNPGADVCDNCHGDGLGSDTSWNFDEANASTTDHTDPYSGNTGDKMDRHSVCETCHGWGHANYVATWGGTPPAHGDGSITMNGPDAPPGPAAGAEYDDATGGCAQACHGIALVLNANSGWPINYGNFGSGACEGCHNGVQTQYPLAPNVMGDGTLPAGDLSHTSPQPFDDGAYGYNVNGHGRDGDTSAESHGDPIGVACAGCHDDSFPSGAHLDGVLNGRISPDTRNTNSFHLLSGFLVAAAPANEWDVQLKFDDTCYNTCHTTGTTDMRHAEDTGGIHATPNVVELGQYNSYTVPNNTPPPEMFYDRNLMVSGWARDGAPNFAPCVSCHNPHGTDTASPKNTQNNKMTIHKWAAPPRLCAKCHP